MDKRVVNHFKKADPVLFSYIDKVEPIEKTKPKKPKDYFSSLCREIICQQLSNKAGAAILKKFNGLFPGERVTAERILKTPREKIRAAGPSWAKADFVRDLASKVVSGELDLKSLDELGDKAVAQQLMTVKGIGPWTAEMFLMFSLGREDVFSCKDLGLRKAIQKIYGLKKEPTPEQLERISEKWAPYRTYASRVLWRINDLPKA